MSQTLEELKYIFRDVKEEPYEIKRDYRKMFPVYRCAAELSDETNCSRFETVSRDRCKFAVINYGIKTCIHNGIT